MGLHRSQYVFRATALSELAVTVITHYLNGTLHVSLVGHKTLAEVVVLASGFQNLSLEEREGRVVPAGARTVLVLHAGDRILLDGGEYGFVGIFCGCLLLGSRCTDSDHRHECEC